MGKHRKQQVGERLPLSRASLQDLSGESMKAKPIPDSISQVLEIDELCESGLRYVNTGKPARSKHHTGYFRVKHKGKSYLAHRIVWLLATGVDAGGKDIDHVDGNKSNNKIENLRLCTSTQNGYNQGKQKHNRQKYKGVSKHGERGYQARITIDGKLIALGTFKTQEQAAEAYNQAAIKHHGEYARLNVIEGKDEIRQ